MKRMIRLNLTLFGSFAASIADQPLTRFRTDKMRALVAYLAINEDRPFRRELLAALLWPEWPDDAARRNLRQTIHRLRQMLDKAAPDLSGRLLTMTRQTVQLNGAAVRVDVTQFQKHLQATETHSHIDLHHCTQCLTHMQQAADLYQGDFLMGFGIKDAFPFEEWLIMQRDQLQQQMLMLLDELSSAYEQQGEYEKGQRAAHQQVQIAPWRESAHRQLMRLYMLQKDRPSALAQYESCRQLLAQELAVDPSAETMQLWQQIKDGSFQAAVSPHTPTHGFPVQLTPFIGRQDEISQVLTHLANQECRLLTLIGPGGIGKTRLSIQVVQELSSTSSRYRDGAYFIPLAAVSDEERLFQTIAQHLNIQLGEQATPRQQLLAYLHDKSLLLVCDNFEQIVAGADQLAEIVRQAPGVQILVTSRRPLNLQAEWRQVVGGLDYSQGAASDAVSFFQRSAQRVAPQFRLRKEDVAAVLDLCRLVDGMPLALELAAAWTRLMDCPAILRETQKSIDFLTTSREDLPARHQSIRAVLNQSWQMLPGRLQTVLGQMAFFSGTFTLDAALAIVPDLSVLDIATLLDRSLLEWHPNGRYQMHELLRHFASTQPVSQLDIFQENFTRYFLKFVADQGEPLLSQTPQQAVTVFQQDLDNVRQAWQWAIAQEAIDLIEAALNALVVYHEFRGSYDEGRQQFAAAAAALPPSVLVNRLRLAEARCLEVLGEPAQAIALTQGVVEANRPETQLPALIRLGRLYERTSEYDLALSTLDKALALADEQAVEAAQIWNIFGIIYRYRGMTDESIQAHRKALTICSVLDEPLVLAETHADLSLSYKDKAAYDEAVIHIEQALTIAKRLGHDERISGFTHSLGVLYWQQDKLDKAAACWTQSMAIAERLNYTRLVAICCNGLGVIARRNQRFDEALRYLRRALHLAQQLEEKSLQAIMLGIIGMVYQDMGEYQPAVEHMQQAVEIDRSTGAISGVGRHLGNIGDTLKIQHRYADALPYFEEAIGYFRQSTAYYYLCWVLISYAECLLALGRVAEAAKANGEGGALAAEIGREPYQQISVELAAKIQKQR